MPGPLDGVKVVDLSAIIAGPMATCILADQGAEVLKIEPPGIGDFCRWLGPSRNGMGAMFAAVNRNKRSVVLNLKDERAKAVLRDLLHTADVFVQNFRPGAIQRMGFSHEALVGLNPGLIYVSMSGFGQDGPYAKRRVYDPVVQATSGFADSQQDSSGKPHLIQSIVCDKVTALTAAQAITAALYAKSRARARGEAGGQHLTLNMLDASIAFNWPDVFYNLSLLDNDAAPSPDFSSFYGILPTKDGFITVLTLSDDEFGDYCRAMGHEEFKDDPRFKDVFSRMTNAAELKALFAEETLKWATADLRTRLEAEDVPHAVVLRRELVPDDPQVRHNGTLAVTLHPKAGQVREPVPAARFGATPSALRLHAPALGEHTDAVLAEIGRSSQEIAALREAGAIA